MKEKTDLSELLLTAYKKMMANDSKSLETSIKEVNEFIQYSQKKLTILEWIYYLNQKTHSVLPPGLEDTIRDEVTKVIMRICLAIDEHSLFSDEHYFTREVQEGLWEKIFFIFETLSCSKMLSNLENLDKYCLNTVVFLKKFLRSYMYSHVSFNLIYTQQLMGEQLQSILKSLNDLNEEKYSLLKSQLLQEIHRQYALAYFLGNEFTLAINQLERSSQQFSLSLKKLLSHKEISQKIITNFKNQVLKIDSLMPGQPQIDELNSRIKAMKFTLNQSKSLLSLLLKKDIPHLLPQLNRIKETLDSQACRVD